MDYEIEGNVLKAYKGSQASVVIPDGVSVIAPRAFFDCDTLITVKIPEGVTKIGDEAFTFSDNMTSVYISGSVADIGESAFGACASLEQIEVAEENACYTSFEGALFNKDMSVLIQCPAGMTGGFRIPDGVKTIAASAFFNCRDLTDVFIPASVEEISDEAFWGCSSLKSLIIPEGVRSIGKIAFKGCVSLSQLSIPESVTSIGNYILSGCRALHSVTIPDKVENSEHVFGLRGTEEIMLSSLFSGHIPHQKLNRFMEEDIITICRVFLQDEPSYDESDREHYSAYAREYRDEILLDAIDKRDSAAVYGALKFGLIPQENLDHLISISAVKGTADITAILLEYENGIRKDERQDGTDDI